MVLLLMQLRDLIACPVSRDEILAVDQRSICKYNTVEEKSTPLFKSLTFTPVSLGSGYGYVAAGGQHSQVIVKSLNSPWSHEFTSGRYVNNSVCISKSLGDTQMLLCNNDETIKVYSLPGMVKINTLKFDTAVNYASVSPDRKKLVVVGDSSRVSLFEVSADSGPGFCCSWNHLSEKFAVASQDGSVSVWDIRSTKHLAQLSSYQRTPLGACRAVKFALAGAVDLLAFSEHVSYVNVIDSRTLEAKQSINISHYSSDNNIAGITFSPDGGSLFVATSGATLEYRVDFAARRRFSESSVT